MVPSVDSSQRALINWKLFISKLNNTKPYKGDSYSLNDFLIRCDQLLTTYQAYRHPVMEIHVLEFILKKLFDRAQIMIGYRRSYRPPLEMLLSNTFPMGAI